MELTLTDGYRQLLEQISDVYTQGRVRAVQAVNAQLIETYWQVGRHIVEYEQAGNLRAEYGKALINNLAADLGLRYGRGFSRSNVVYMRLLYLRYPISQKPSHQLSWSHYVELLKLDDDLERGFYEKQAIAERWSVPELKRQKAASLFLRLAVSTDKAGILQLAAQGQIVQEPADLLREPYVFEFLKIPEPYQISETQLETVLCDHLPTTRPSAYAVTRLGWIRRQQAKLRAQARDTPRQYVERESHYLWGRRYLLSVVEADAKPIVQLDHRRITLRVRPGSTLAKREEVLSAWHRALLHAAVPVLIRQWEGKLGVRSTATSCSA
jgi:hypothetical protein